MSVPEQAVLLTGETDNFRDGECLVRDHQGQPPQISDFPLNGQGFVLTSWNIYKQQNPGWSEDLTRISNATDLLLLQEARLDAGLIGWLNSRSLYWSLNPAFYQRQGAAGVMMVSRARPLRSCGQHMLEPWLGLPKASMVSFYPLQGHATPLLVANIHGVNFTLDEVWLRRQLSRLADYIRDHRGPVVLAGDFNTWNLSRQQAVEQFAEAEGLYRVAFPDQQPAQHFGRTLDHIYVRGLVDLYSEVRVVESSDHYPLTVMLALEEGNDE